MSTITQDLYDSHKMRGMYVDTMYAPYRSWRVLCAPRVLRLRAGIAPLSTSHNDSISANIRKWSEHGLHSESKRSAISSDRNRRCALCAIIRLKLHENIIHSEMRRGRCGAAGTNGFRMHGRSEMRLSSRRRIARAHADVTIIIDPRYDRYRHRVQSHSG
jgi:hypothetical protein